MSNKRETESVNFRISAEKKAFIEYAAKLTGKTKTDFYTDSAVQAAEEAVLDHRIFKMDDDTYLAFTKAIDEPVHNEKLLKLLNSKSPWEE